MACPVCGGSKWKAMDGEISPPFKSWGPMERPKGVSRRAKPVLPLVPMVCRNCAYTAMFLAAEYQGVAPK